ncbi:Lysophospholipid_acyltransferase [Hexamita inflata]|uniref:Lysophospholipid acyltransferase n=1 Tax=Hexamita inflata TaxID=28002 RepID=A0AA86V092_9EUKA|nr:Lysophospholipid acyltransferase [Hexamita inflata]
MKTHTHHHPFAPVIPDKSIKYWLYWLFSLGLSPIIIPIRLLSLILALLCNSLGLDILLICQDTSQPFSPWRLKIIRKFQIFIARIVSFGFGILIIEREKKLKPTQKANVLISNHGSILDGLILCCKGFTSFVTRKKIRKIPILSTYIDSCQCVYKPNNDAGTIKLITERIVEQNGYPSLTIFPEGTIENSTAIIPFKLHAFNPMKPVSMVCIQFDQSYMNISNYDRIGFLKILFGLYTIVRMEYLGELTPFDGEDAQDFANRARDLYSQKFGFEKVDCTTKDNQYFTGKIKDYELTSYYYKTQFGPEVTRKNGYVVSLKKLKMSQ